MVIAKGEKERWIQVNVRRCSIVQEDGATCWLERFESGGAEKAGVRYGRGPGFLASIALLGEAVKWRGTLDILDLEGIRSEKSIALLRGGSIRSHL